MQLCAGGARSRWRRLAAGRGRRIAAAHGRRAGRGAGHAVRAAGRDRARARPASRAAPRCRSGCSTTTRSSLYRARAALSPADERGAGRADAQGGQPGLRAVERRARADAARASANTTCTASRWPARCRSRPRSTPQRAQGLREGRAPVAKALSAAQVRYLREAVHVWPLPDGLRALGPDRGAALPHRRQALRRRRVAAAAAAERYAEIARKVAARRRRARARRAARAPGARRCRGVRGPIRAGRRQAARAAAPALTSLRGSRARGVRAVSRAGLAPSSPR